MFGYVGWFYEAMINVKYKEELKRIRQDVLRYENEKLHQIRLDVFQYQNEKLQQFYDAKMEEIFPDKKH